MHVKSTTNGKKHWNNIYDLRSWSIQEHLKRVQKLGPGQGVQKKKEENGNTISNLNHICWGAARPPQIRECAAVVDPGGSLACSREYSGITKDGVNISPGPVSLFRILRRVGEDFTKWLPRGRAYFQDGCYGGRHWWSHVFPPPPKGIYYKATPKYF